MTIGGIGGNTQESMDSGISSFVLKQGLYQQQPSDTISEIRGSQIYTGAGLIP